MGKPDVVVVGAGLAGLACALDLVAAGRGVLVLEGADGPGGRVRTDLVEGFRLDRGFQVLLTAYPEARRRLDYEALDLRRFAPGALTRKGGRMARLDDPFRRPGRALAALLAPVGTLRDKWEVGRLRREVRRGAVEDLWERPNRTTLELLQGRGFSPDMIEGFFRPWMGGVFCDRALATSSRMFEFVFRMFAEGDVAVPAGGMQAIPDQLAARLPAGTVRTGTGVASIEADGVVLASGERVVAQDVVVATGADEAGRLLPAVPVPGWRGVTCLYFAADRPPIQEPMLVLAGDEAGPVNNFHVASNVAPTYAPAGAALCSATVLDDAGRDDAALEAAVRAQLAGWFGPGVHAWRHLRTYRIPHALPDQAPPALTRPRRPARVARSRYATGDHRDHASIEGALASGRRVAEVLLEDRRGGTA